MSMQLRIGLVSTLASPVIPGEGGSVEGLVGTLANELTRRGHEVTLFASGDSEVECRVVATFPRPYGVPGGLADWHMCEWSNLATAVEQSSSLDVLHSHVYLWGLPLERFSSAPMIHTTHVRPWADDAAFVGLSPRTRIIAISEKQWQAYPSVTPMAVVHHGVDPGLFVFRCDPEDYVCWIGRFVPGKGVLQAIEMAQALGVRLVLAAPPNAYYETHVRAHVDGKLVEYVGAVGGEERSRLLGGARAVLYPVQEPEPFGLVLIEAMMCGTPVIALELGAASEVVDDGRTGILLRHPEDVAEAYQSALRLDRRSIRDIAVSRFSAERMVDGYEAAYLAVAR